MKKLLKIFLLLFTLILTGCFGYWDSASDRITGKYIVLCVDDIGSRCITEEIEMNSSSSSEVIPAYVFAVGHNDDFIIVKQHPTGGVDSGFDIDNTITNFYIIDLNGKVLKNGEKFGPLNQVQFDSLRKKLKIEKIEFDQNYSDNP